MEIADTAVPDSYQNQMQIQFTEFQISIYLVIVCLVYCSKATNIPRRDCEDNADSVGGKMEPSSQKLLRHINVLIKSNCGFGLSDNVPLSSSTYICITNVDRLL